MLVSNISAERPQSGLSDLLLGLMCGNETWFQGFFKTDWRNKVCNFQGLFQMQGLFKTTKIQDLFKIVRTMLPYDMQETKGRGMVRAKGPRERGEGREKRIGDTDKGAWFNMLAYYVPAKSPASIQLSFPFSITPSSPELLKPWVVSFGLEPTTSPFTTCEICQKYLGWIRGARRGNMRQEKHKLEK